MAKIVYLPREINRELDGLAESGRKVEGILFCEELNHGEKNRACIEAILVNLNYDRNTQSQQNNEEIANEFFREHPLYWPIKFFTCPDRVERVGWVCRRSEEFNEMERELKNNDSTAMVVTPSIKRLIGNDMRLMIIENPLRYREKNRAIMESLRQIAENRSEGAGNKYVS